MSLTLTMYCNEIYYITYLWIY